MCKIHKRLLVAATLSFAALSTTAQQQRTEPTPAQKKAAYEELQKLTPEQRHERYLKAYKRKPIHAENPSKKKINTSADISTNTSKTTKATAIVPNDARFPGEFEEVQGIFISWIYDDVSGVIDTVSSSDYANIFSKLADGIQKAGVPVYINIWYAADSNAVKTFMANNGTPLFNYRFLVHQGDAFWTRDFGPINYYYDTDDKIGWVDLRYYPGRDLDNVMPNLWGAELGIPVASSTLYFEGGNILTDGTQNMATSDAVYDLNSYYNAYSASRTRDSIRSNMNLSRLDVLKALPHDGGTGHIDLYLDMTDENTFVYTKMPTAMSSVVGFTDYAIANNNVDTLKMRNSYHSKPYRFFTIPFPTRDDGSWYSSATDYEYYTRTYSNHLIVNKTIIQPIFSNASSGYAVGDAAAIDSIKKSYPGYNIVPIDMRAFDGFGGSIHCITKDFAATNPIRFLHYAYRNREAYQSGYPIDAIITNKSGISSATLYWRLKGASTWTSVTMTSASGNHWLASIPASSSSTVETFEYYISATSTNGKTITRPMPGAAGPYLFWYDKASSIAETQIDGFALGNLYPNPAKDKVNMEVIVENPLPISVNITDIMGKQVAEQNYGLVSSTRYLTLSTEQLVPGIYTIHVMSNGLKIASRKLVKQ